MRCDLRGGRLDLGFGSRIPGLSRRFEVGHCGVPLLRDLEDSRARDHLLEKIGAFASHGFP